MEHIQHLVFCGGGQRVVAFLGSLQALQQAGLNLKQLRGAAGTSAGALLATALVLGCSLGELLALIHTLGPQLLGLLSLSPIRLWQDWGLDSGRMLGQLVDTLLALKLGVPAGCTLGQLAAITGRRLVLVASDLLQYVPAYLSADTQPHMPVALAVQASMTIPFVFVPVRWQGMLLVDGYFTDNFPLHLFPSASTLGFYLDSKCTIAPTDLASYTLRLMRAATAHNVCRQRAAAWTNLIVVDLGAVPTLAAQLLPALVVALLFKGYAAVEQWLAAQTKAVASIN